MMISKYQKRILKYLYPYKQIDSTEFRKLFRIDFNDFNIRELYSLKLITTDSSKLYNPSVIKLTEQGRAYVEEFKNDEIRFWVPIIISNMLSIAALVVAILAYLKR